MSPAAVQRGDRRLRALLVPALVEDRVAQRRAEVLEQRERVRGGPPDKARAQSPSTPVRVGILQHGQGPEVGPFGVGIAERIDDGGSRNVEDGQATASSSTQRDAVDRHVSPIAWKAAVATAFPRRRAPS